jgi:hypothetical protein
MVMPDRVPKECYDDLEFFRLEPRAALVQIWQMACRIAF